MSSHSSMMPFLKGALRGDLGQVYRASHDPAVSSSLVFRIAKSLAETQHGKRYKSRIVNFPPPYLFWKLRQEAESPADFIHRAYCRALWRERGAWARAELLAIYPLWPLVFAVTSIWATVLNGPAIARLSGKSMARQMAEQLIAAWKFGCLPQWYYMFELFDAARLARGGEYLHRFETKGGIYRLMQPATASEAVSPLGNKVRFAERCRANNLPIAEEHFICRAGDLAGQPKLPPNDLFIKPQNENGGVGAEAWLYTPDGQYQSLLDGERLSEERLLHRITTGNRSVIVQTRLVNHDAIRDLSNGALATVRLMTFLNETGEYEATRAGLRMAIGKNHLVDNFHAGGIIAAIDMATGRLGPASDIGLRPDIGWRDRHPDTGAVIEGRVLPFWQDTVDLACRAHAAFAPRVIVGWDIAITSRGPVLIEGNGSPDVDLLQRACRGPIGNSRLGELIRFHLRNNPATLALIGSDP